MRDKEHGRYTWEALMRDKEHGRYTWEALMRDKEHGRYTWEASPNNSTLLSMAIQDKYVLKF